MAEKSSGDQANIQQKLGLVWRNRKKISQLIKDYFFLPFFLLIIFWTITAKRYSLAVFEQQGATHVLATSLQELKGVMGPIQLSTTRKKEGM
jgi:hypothetical protein